MGLAPKAKVVDVPIVVKAMLDIDVMVLDTISCVEDGRSSFQIVVARLRHLRFIVVEGSQGNETEG